METATKNQKNGTGKSVYAIVTERIIEQLNKGVVPWRQPWTDAGLPCNLISKKPYRGINLMLLGSLGYAQNYFLSYKQLEKIGGKAKKDEKPHIVVYWNFPEKKQDDDMEGAGEKKAILRYYSVLNVAQCENIPADLIPQNSIREVQPITACENVMIHMPNCPKVKYKEQKAYYNPLLDFINMPKENTFESMESYYSTLFHELVHSTGHHSRLNRICLAQMAEFGSEQYSLEELVAEIGTCYLQSFTGITQQFEQSMAYIQGWLKKLKNDSHFVVTASSMAQKAIDYIHNVQESKEEIQPEE